MGHGGVKTGDPATSLAQLLELGTRDQAEGWDQIWFQRTRQGALPATEPHPSLARRHPFLPHRHPSPGHAKARGHPRESQGPPARGAARQKEQLVSMSCWALRPGLEMSESAQAARPALLRGQP